MRFVASNATPIEAFGDIEPIPHDGLFDADGLLIPQPAAFWASKTIPQRAMFGHETGLYAFPTLEAIAFIKRCIGGRETQTIEIGAGAGIWGKHLGIRCTDSYLQRRPDVMAEYRQMGQKPAPYGKHVEKIEAVKAVRKYRPKVVVASWVTQKFRADRFCMRGNVDGVDELRIVPMVDSYIFIGHNNSHGDKMILEDVMTGRHPTHEMAELMTSGTYSRAQASEGDFIIHIARKAIE